MKEIRIIAVLCFASFGVLAQLPGYVPNNGLVGYWPFENNANDLSSNANNGIVQGATPTTDRFNAANKAYDFNGVSDYIRVPNHTSLSNLPNLTISAWIKTDTLNGDHAIVAKWYQNLNCGSNSDTYIAHLQYGQIQFVTDFNNTIGLTAKPSLTSAYLNAWKHLAFVFRNAASLEVYIDGNNIYTTPTTGTGICSSINDLFFGADVTGSNQPSHRFFSGAMDDIGLWSRDLSACEIKKLYLSESLTTSSSSSVICHGGSATITVGGAVTYSLNGSVITSTAMVSPSSTTVYTVTGNYGLSGCNDITTLSITVSECTGISEIDFPDAIALYPNPSKGYLTCASKLFTETDCKVIIEDISGKKMLQKSLMSEKCEMDIHEFESGIYLLRILNGEERVIRKEKIILNK